MPQRPSIDALLRRHGSPALTHGLLLGMLAAHFALLVYAPLWLAFVPGVLLVHRVGILGHEYIHGIPLKQTRHCLAVVTAIDGVMTLFGVYELYRGMHLAHHRWLNQAGDPAMEHTERERARGLRALLGAGEVGKTLGQLALALRGQHSHARAQRIVFGALASLAWIGLWAYLGRLDVPLHNALIVVVTAAVPSSLRAAIEHNAEPTNPAFANEYEVLLSLFNLNRHVHHHLEPGRPWYALEFKTDRPLPWTCYFTHWYRVHITREFTTMQPMRRVQPMRERY